MSAEELKELPIAGGGVAGSYLYALMSDRFTTEVKVYDGAKKRGCSCAFGCFYTQLKEKLKRVGLNVEDYILCKNKGLILNGVYVPLRNQISIDKPKLVKDLCPRVIKKKVFLSDFIRRKEWVINATGVPMWEHYVIPTKQYRVKLKGLEPAVNYIHLDTKYVGYGWAFSLDEEGKWFHLGAGCVNADPEILIKALIRRYKVKVEKEVCSCDRPIRVVNPEDIFSESIGTVVSIGEANGYVFPVTGEGILPSMDSAELLVESMWSPAWPVEYYFKTKEYFEKWNYDKAFKVWRLMEKHPRTAWLYGFRFMFKRASKRAQPELTLLRLIKLAVKMVIGGGYDIRGGKEVKIRMGEKKAIEKPERWAKLYKEKLKKRGTEGSR